jgi:diacylglycerol kinase family enzyme
MDNMGISYVFKSTLPARQTVTMVAEAILNEGYRTVAYLGGDGTFYEVATGICQSGFASEVTLGMLPSGTANDQGKSFGVSSSIKSLEKNVRIIFEGHTTMLDVGEVTAYSDAGLVMRRDLFFDSLGWGLSASILAQRNRDIKRTRDVPLINQIYRDHLVYVRAALQEVAMSLVSRDRFSAEVESDGELYVWHNLTDLLVSNTLIFAGDWIVDPESEHDDGKVEIAPFVGIRDWAGKVIVNHKKFPFKKDTMERMGFGSSTVVKGKKIRIKLIRANREETLPAELDGEEFLSANFFEIDIHSRLLRLIVPQKKQWI